MATTNEEVKDFLLNHANRRLGAWLARSATLRKELPPDQFIAFFKHEISKSNSLGPWQARAHLVFFRRYLPKSFRNLQRSGRGS